MLDKDVERELEEHDDDWSEGSPLVTALLVCCCFLSIACRIVRLERVPMLGFGIGTGLCAEGQARSVGFSVSRCLSWVTRRLGGTQKTI